MEPLRMLRELMRWDPFAQWDPLSALESQIPTFIPNIELKETNDGFVIKADLPGMNPDDIEVNLVGNRLTISGKREEEDKEDTDRYFAYERTYGSFSRTFRLPDGVDVDHLKAELDHGVLTLTVPKRPEVQGKRIPVGVTGQGKTLEQGQQAPSGRQTISGAGSTFEATAGPSQSATQSEAQPAQPISQGLEGKQVSVTEKAPKAA